MRGSLVVKGDVHSTFCVEASGDVEIRGGVEGSVHAGGSLQIQRGIRGSWRRASPLKATSSAQQAEYAELYSGGLLRLGAGVHAKLAAQRVEISNKLRGGVTQAERGVLVSEAGSPQGVQTEVEVGTPLESPSKRRSVRSNAPRPSATCAPAHALSAPRAKARARPSVATGRGNASA